MIQSGEEEINLNKYWDMSGETTQNLYLMLGLLEELKVGKIVINKVKDEIMKREHVQGETLISQQSSVHSW